MKPIAIPLMVAVLALGVVMPVARVDAETELAPTQTTSPRPTPTTKACHLCEEELIPSPTPKPVVNLWLFYDSHCSDCVKLLRDILPPLLVKYAPDQVMVYKYDLEKGPSDMMRALEQWHGLTQGDVPEIFIGEHVLLGNQQIQDHLAAWIDHYLAQGGVELLRPAAAATLALSPTPTASKTPSAQTTPVVHAVLFWSKTCPHCHEVINNVLPPLQQKYGAQLDIRMFELSDPASLQLFQAALDALHVPPDLWGVPLMIVGDQVLVGSLDIPQQLPALIEKHLAAGGMGWPQIPGLAQWVGVNSTQTPPASPMPNTPPPVARVLVDDTPVPLSTPLPTILSTTKPVVRGVMFWMNGCPHCEEVLNRVLPPLQQKYGAQLDIRLIEVVTTQDVDRLYQIAASFGIPKEQTGVPFLIIGAQALVGSDQIPAELPAVVEKYIAAGGVELPTLAGLDATRMPTPSVPNPTCLPTVPDCGTETAKGVPVQTILRTDPAGFALALIVMLGMVGALVRVVFDVRRHARTSVPVWMNGIVPLLIVLGIGIAGYLAYVEMFEVSAICGPIGHCNTVQQSPYARLFGVLPIGVLGVLGYLAILGAWLVGQIGREPFTLWARRVAFAFAALGVLFSLYLTFLEPFVIGAVCAWCLTSAVIMTALMLLLTRPALQPLNGTWLER